MLNGVSMNYLQEMESLAGSLYRNLMNNVQKDKCGFPLYHVPDKRIIKDCIAQVYGYPYWDEYIVALKNNVVVHQIEHSDRTFALYQKLVEYKQVLDSIAQNPACIVHKMPDISENLNKTHLGKDNNDEKKTKYRHFKPVIFGQSSKYKNYWGFYKKRISEDWQLNRYPLTIFGSMGSAKTDVYRTLSQKWMANHEGYILLSADIHNEGHYDFILNVAKLNNRLDDVYVLKGYEDYFYNTTEADNGKEKDTLDTTHTIDPINPLIGNVWAFQQLFGENVGIMIHHIAKEIQDKGCLLDWQTLASLISWENLNKWIEDRRWGQTTTHIENYVLSTGNVDMHADNCVMATRTIQTLKKYSEKGLFSLQPDIRLTDIFARRQILAILLTSEIRGSMEEKMLNMIMTINVHHAANVMDKNNIENNFWQNILLIEPETLLYQDNWTSPHLLRDFFNNLAHSSNWVFGGYSPYKDSHVMNEAIRVSQTIFMMKTECRAEQLPEGLRLKVLSKAMDKDKLLTDSTVYAHLPKEQHPQQIHDLRPFDGYFFTQGLSDKNSQTDYVNHDTHQYYFQRIVSDYYSFTKTHRRYLYKHYHNSNVLAKVPKEHEEKIVIEPNE
jgi:hypothetical protein